MTKSMRWFALSAAAVALGACSDTVTSPTSQLRPSAPALTIGPTANVGPVQVTLASDGTTQFCSAGTVIHGYTIPASYTPLAGCGTASDLETALTTSYNPGWTAPFTGSDWIGPNATANEYKTAPGTYVFQTQFTIPTGATSPVLNDTLKSDNAVAVFINGTALEQQVIQDCTAAARIAGTCNWQTAFIISDANAAHFNANGVTNGNTITVLLVDTPNGGNAGNSFACTTVFQPNGEIGFGTPFTNPTSPNHVLAGWTTTMTSTTGCENPTGLDFHGSVSWVAPVVNHGCTLGFWKNHEDIWPSPYTPSTTLGSVFTNTGTSSGSSFDDALSFSGGPTVQDAKNLLLKQAVAALLNAKTPGMNYPLTTAQIITQVDAALATGNRATILALATTLDGDNSLEGPLC